MRGGSGATGRGGDNAGPKAEGCRSGARAAVLSKCVEASVGDQPRIGVEARRLHVSAAAFANADAAPV